MNENISEELQGAAALVIGAGPSGLATAKCLQDYRVPVVIADRFGLAGGAYRRMYPYLALSSPPEFLSLPGMELRVTGSCVRAKQYSEYLAAYAAHHRIVITRNEVMFIERSASGVAVTFNNAQPFIFKAVIVATGMCDYPVAPEIPGLTLNAQRTCVLHAQDWSGPLQWAGSQVVIVGGGMRAVELAEECAAAGLRPVITTRGGQIDTWSPGIFGWDVRHLGFAILRRLPTQFVRSRCARGWRFRAIDRGFNRLVAQGKINIAPEITRINGKHVQFTDGSSVRADVVILATGYKFDMPFLPASVRRSRGGYPLVKRGQCIDLPSVYFVGVPCAFRLDSQFVHGIAADAMEVATAVAAMKGFGSQSGSYQTPLARSQ